jgi:hypothetical protein
LRSDSVKVEDVLMPFYPREVLQEWLAFGNVPLWLMQFLDTGRLFARAFRRYPLADKHGTLSCRPLFIISSGRAGTTLLRSMLVAGGQIAIPPETQVIPLAIRRYMTLQHLGWNDLSRLILALFESHPLFYLWEISLQPAYAPVLNLAKDQRSLARTIDQVFRCYLDQQFPDAMLWGDQSPINTLYWSWVLKTFPNARYLHLLRDGRDAIASMVGTGRTTVKLATSRWISSVDNAVALQNRLPLAQFLEVRYEHLARSPAESLARVCGFVGIDYGDEMLDFWKLPTTIEHKHLRVHQNLGKPIFADSIGAWTKRLTATEQMYVLARTAPWLERLGFL